MIIKRTMLLGTLVAIIGLFLAFHQASFAQPPTPAKLKTLIACAGTWEGRGTYSENGKATPIHVRHKNTVFADGFGLRVDETVTGVGMPSYHAINMFGYDEGEDLVHLYTIDNYGDVHDHKGQWSDEKTLKLRHQGVQKGKKFVEDITATYNSPREFHIVSVVSLDGQAVSTFDVTMKKSGSKPMATSH